MVKATDRHYVDDLERIRQKPILIPKYFYLGQECPHGHRRRHRKHHWCLDCAFKIQLNQCGADINKISNSHRWCYWQLLPYLPSGLDLKECWIVPPHKRSANEKRPVYSTYTYRTFETGKMETIMLSRFIYYWFWGDVGNLTVKRLCDNPCCWNPLHLRSVFNPSVLPSKIYPFNLDVDLNKANLYLDHLKQNPQTLLPVKPIIPDPKTKANIEPGSPFRPLEEIPLVSNK